MKTTITAAALALFANAALAHPGHDHTYAPGGESHVVVLAAASAVLVAGLGTWAYRRFIRSK